MANSEFSADAVRKHQETVIQALKVMHFEFVALFINRASIDWHLILRILSFKR